MIGLEVKWTGDVDKLSGIGTFKIEEEYISMDFMSFTQFMHMKRMLDLAYNKGIEDVSSKAADLFEKSKIMLYKTE